MSHIKNNAKSAVLAGAIAAATVGYAFAADLPVKAQPPKPVPFFLVNDTSVSFNWYPYATDPGVSGSSGTVPGGIPGAGNRISRGQFVIEHFDVWEYGTNFIHGELDQYGRNDPANGIPGAHGAREFFGFWTGTLGFNELSHSKAFSTWLTKDVSFMLNLTGGTVNNFLAPETTQIAPGIQFNLNLPGVVNVGITAYKEWSHNSFDACGPFGFGDATFGANGPCAVGGPFGGDRSFEVTWKLFTLISEPIPNTPLTWINVLNVTGPKGTGISTANCIALAGPAGCGGTPGGIGPFDNFGINETKTEVFEDTRLSLDASKVFWNKPGIWDMYVGYRYWYNKFGTNHNDWLFAVNAPGTSIESTAYLGTTYHFK